MKLERLSENQIRCTLDKTDLTDRHLKLSELAYGTEKAKALFHEMMTQASEDSDSKLTIYRLSLKQSLFPVTALF